MTLYNGHLASADEDAVQAWRQSAWPCRTMPASEEIIGFANADLIPTMPPMP